MVEPATMNDADEICQLVNHYAEREVMLHRSLESVYENLRDFLVCRRDGQFAGCIALAVSGRQLGEIRSLAVAPAVLGQGVGAELVRAAIEDGRELGMNRVFALTYVPEFFARFGFRVVDRETLPNKVWRDCIHCPRADNCQEVAVVLELADL